MLTIKELDYRNYSRLIELDLKEHDKLEALVVYGVETIGELRDLMMETVVFADEAFGIFLGDELIGAFGISSDEEEIDSLTRLFYRPWLFTSNKVAEINAITIARLAKETVKRWAIEYGELYNVAMYSPKMARWLEWLGFKLTIGYSVMTFEMKGE